MLSSLQIQNFRGLKDVKIPTLGRVNLVVGENNAGKSSVLEALRIYASGGNPYVLDNIARSHQEENLSEQYYSEKYNDFDEKFETFSNFFYQRTYPKNDNESIIISDGNDNHLKLSYNKQSNNIYISNCQDNNSIFHDIPIKLEYENHYRVLPKGRGKFSCKYIPTLFISNQELSAYWDKITLTPYENEVIKSLKMIEPDIEKLAFVNNSFNINDRIPVVSLKNGDKPIPLNSMGDGIKRILQLILNLHQAKDGLLLIDEFDNGLHYKVQEKVWGLLFELAERFNVQVFATTHSHDCIRAFSKISQARTDIDGMLIQMTKEHYKDGTSQIVANVVDEESLQCLLNLGVDVR